MTRTQGANTSEGLSILTSMLPAMESKIRVLKMRRVALHNCLPHLDKETIKEHWEDYELDDQHNSHAYNNYSYQRYVSTFDINTLADRQQLLVALGSLSSSVEQYMPHSANCVKCKTNKKHDLIE